MIRIQNQTNYPLIKIELNQNSIEFNLRARIKISISKEGQMIVCTNVLEEENILHVRLEFYCKYFLFIMHMKNSPSNCTVH